MPSRPAARPFHPDNNSVGDARSRIEALFGSLRMNYPVRQPPNEMERWLNRPLEAGYAAMFFDTLMLRTRDHGLLRATRLHFALGILDDGTKDIVGVWTEQTASSWPDTISQLRTRGVVAIGLAVAEDDAAARAIRAAFPSALVVPSVKRLALAAADHLPLETRRAAINAMVHSIVEAEPSGTSDEITAGALAAFWQENSECLGSILSSPPAVRELVCTTSAVESIAEKLRRRGLSKRANYTTTEAAIHDLAFVLRDAHSSWKVSQRKWAAVREYLRNRT